ncbi:MAG TPA: hypothetical protein DCW68_07730 [Rhodospirillaceae bacterium]|nr:MAG: hypothetical protein A2018_08050 [Alphaproteobacteria bacterium GWF2_58_20]HAU29977.1 hypothetical protein [Rhodospirillaceae bacterium]
MTSLKTVLEKLVAGGGRKLPPASDAGLTSAEMTLAALGAPGLPPDFVAFLRVSDGAVYHHIRFFGTADIAMAQEDMFRSRRPPHFLGLGQADDDVYAFDARDGAYKILDPTDCEDFGTFASFAELMDDAVGE